MRSMFEKCSLSFQCSKQVNNNKIVNTMREEKKEELMSIQDVIKAIAASQLKRDLLHEMTPTNKEILRKMGSGTFEAVLTGNGDEKCLIPEVGTLQYLYRGQNEEYVPCVPSIYRGNPSEEEIFVERMRLDVFCRLLDSHPVIDRFFKRHNFKVDYEGLAQHYGLKTSVLDLTSSIDIAMFFATCKYDRDADKYFCYDDGEIHEAILYVFDPILDNEPSPSVNEVDYMNKNITPIGLQAFPRPGIQQGYALHIAKGESLKCWMYRFSFTCNDSKYYYDKFDQGKTLWTVDDILIRKTKAIANQQTFSFDVFNKTYSKFRPKGFSKTMLKRRLPSNIILKTKVSNIEFSDEEKYQIVEEWNSIVGAEMASKIRRKPWFEHEGVDENSGKINGISNKNDFRSLKRLDIMQTLKMIGSPDPPVGAIWINYTGKPRPKEKCRKNVEWVKVPAYMENLFGKEYLIEEDWKI